MLEDPAKGLVYVPMSIEMWRKLAEWSDPVQLKVMNRSDGEQTLVVRKLEAGQAFRIVPD